MEGTQLSSEEQAQFLEEAAALSGTNDNSVETEVETTTDNSEETTEVETEEGGQEETDVKESKTEKKIKKLLSKKNQAEKKVETLEEKVERLESESNTNKFYADFPEAKEHGEKIDAVLEERPSFTREDAYFYLQGRGEIQARSGSNKFTGRPSTGLSTPKDPNKLSTEDMGSYLKDNFNAGGFDGLI